MRDRRRLSTSLGLLHLRGACAGRDGSRLCRRRLRGAEMPGAAGGREQRGVHRGSLRRGLRMRCFEGDVRRACAEVRAGLRRGREGGVFRGRLRAGDRVPERPIVQRMRCKRLRQRTPPSSKCFTTASPFPHRAPAASRARAWAVRFAWAAFSSCGGNGVSSEVSCTCPNCS